MLSHQPRAKYFITSLGKEQAADYYSSKTSQVLSHTPQTLAAVTHKYLHDRISFLKIKSTSKPQKNNEAIASDILLLIFSNFSPQEILNKFQVVCKHWQSVALEDLLWKQLCLRYMKKIYFPSSAKRLTKQDVTNFFHEVDTCRALKGYTPVCSYRTFLMESGVLQLPSLAKALASFNSEKKAVLYFSFKTPFPFARKEVIYMQESEATTGLKRSTLNYLDAATSLHFLDGSVSRQSLHEIILTSSFQMNIAEEELRECQNLERRSGNMALALPLKCMNEMNTDSLELLVQYLTSKPYLKRLNELSTSLELKHKLSAHATEVAFFLKRMMLDLKQFMVKYDWSRSEQEETSDPLHEFFQQYYFSDDILFSLIVTASCIDLSAWMKSILHCVIPLPFSTIIQKKLEKEEAAEEPVLESVSVQHKSLEHSCSEKLFAPNIHLFLTHYLTVQDLAANQNGIQKEMKNVPEAYYEEFALNHEHLKQLRKNPAVNLNLLTMYHLLHKLHPHYWKQDCLLTQQTNGLVIYSPFYHRVIKSVLITNEAQSNMLAVTAIKDQESVHWVPMDKAPLIHSLWHHHYYHTYPMCVIISTLDGCHFMVGETPKTKSGQLVQPSMSLLHSKPTISDLLSTQNFGKVLLWEVIQVTEQQYNSFYDVYDNVDTGSRKMVPIIYKGASQSTVTTAAKKVISDHCHRPDPSVLRSLPHFRFKKLN